MSAQTPTEVWMWGDEGLDATGVYLSQEAAQAKAAEEFARSWTAKGCEGTEWRVPKDRPNVLVLYGTYPSRDRNVTERTPRYQSNTGFFVRRLPVLDGGGAA